MVRSDGMRGWGVSLEALREGRYSTIITTYSRMAAPGIWS